VEPDVGVAAENVDDARDLSVGRVPEKDEINLEDNEETYEVRKPKPIRQPKTPTKAEVSEHFPLHLPYRDWCAHCVAGRATGIQHRRAGTEEESIGTTVCMDYCFLTDEEEDNNVSPILVLYDHRLQAIWSLPVDRKGSEAWVVKWITNKLDEAGYAGQDITLKSDGEPALMDLKKSVIAVRCGITVPIESPVRQSKSNGAMERAIRTWQGYFRTLKGYFEEKVKTKLDRSHSLFSWMVIWSSEALNRYKVHTNGRTSYEMMTGHKAARGAPGFGERVMFKLADQKKKAQSGVRLGLWDFCGHHLPYN